MFEGGAFARLNRPEYEIVWEGTLFLLIGGLYRPYPALLSMLVYRSKSGVSPDTGNML